MTRLLAVLILFLLPACAGNSYRLGNPRAASHSAASSTNIYWACHRGKWKKVATPALSAHRRHGDRVVTSRRPPAYRCR